MKISYNWLKKYLDIPQGVEDLAEVLTNIGLEVEGVERVESIKGGLKGIVVGKIKDCSRHPNADKLSIAKVDIAGEALLNIVCGAPNVAVGQKVLVATVGTELYNADGESWKIKKGKIRGEVSEGMICAEDELGLGDDHSGIIVLPEDVSEGTPASEYYELNDDIVFEIGLTPNRSDATSHWGVASDLAAYYRVNGYPDIQLSDFINISESKPDNAFQVDVKVENSEDCKRYTGVCMSNISTTASPGWMQDLLKSIGVRPINNVVDITNFILHAYGQPLHAFDADKIGGDEIRVKNLKSGTKFTSLDEKERLLHEKDLMICDAMDKPMCIAGVFGGMHSGVTESTRRIFLESAYFGASTVRKSSTRHGLRTEAARIFEKGSDPNITLPALRKAIQLLTEYADATQASEIIDVYPDTIKRSEIILRYDQLRKITGANVSNEKIHDVLEAMDMQVELLNANEIRVSVPTNKADVTREIDVIEEFLRIYGYNNVEIPSVVRTTIKTRNHPDKRKIQNTLAELLSANGFNEMMGLSLVESKQYESLEQKLVHVNNTSNISLDIMRPDALISALDSIARNLNHQQSELRLYEFGKTYLQGEDRFVESAFLSLFLCGQAKPASWRDATERTVDVFDIKAWVHMILERLNIQGYQVSEIENSAVFEYGLNYHRGKKEIVSFGKLSEKHCSNFDLKQDVIAAEFDFENIVEMASRARTSIKVLNKYPGTIRDLALVIEDSVRYQEIRDIISKTEKKLISDVQLFDVYKNDEHLGKGKKSYAIKLKFEDYNKTLRDKDVDKIINSLIDRFGKELGAVIRS